MIYNELGNSESSFTHGHKPAIPSNDKSIYVSGINAKEEGKHYIYNKLLPHPSPNSASPKMSFLSITLLVGILKWPVEEF